MELRKTAFPRLLDRSTDETEASDVWKAVVRHYSRCKLSFYKDKWPAFQGLANEVAKARDWKMVNGLRTHLLGTTELLWNGESPELGTIDVGEPSWSWLNIKGIVELYTDRHKDESDVEITLQNSSTPTLSGQAISKTFNSVLKIKACMARFNTLEKHAGIIWKCTLAVTNPLFDPKGDDGLLHGYWSPDTVPFCDKALRALQILRGHSDRGEENCYESHGLVVQEVEGEPGFWRRVGGHYAQTLHKSDKEQPCPWNREEKTINLI